MTEWNEERTETFRKQLNSRPPSLVTTCLRLDKRAQVRKELLKAWIVPQASQRTVSFFRVPRQDYLAAPDNPHSTRHFQKNEHNETDRCTLVRASSIDERFDCDVKIFFKLSGANSQTG